MDLNNYILFWVCVVGLCLGSFYNVVILRSLSNESIVSPPSKCPKCGHKLYFWHNIPLFSYIVLGGKCYFCKEKISIQYPIVEFVTMVMFALAYLSFGISIKTLFVMLWVSGLIIMTVTDIKEKIVDCNIAIAIAVTGVLYNLIVYGWKGALFSILGLIVCVLILEGIARLGYLFTKTRAMGEADTYVAGALGAIFSLQGCIPVLLYSLIASMFFIIPVFFYSKYKQKDYLACVLLLLFVLSIVIFELYAQNIFTLGFLLVSAIVFVIRIINGIKAGTAQNLLPFVPALAAGALIGLGTFLI